MKEHEASEVNTDKRLKGNERFRFDGKELAKAIVKDFWSWANSDILNNTTRGILAEYLVAQALSLDISKSIRKEWDAYDLLYGETKIEVKSAAYVQSWHQDCCPKSTIGFNIKPKRVEEDKHLEDNGSCKRPWSKERKRRCHVYVFCLLKERERNKVCPLDISQWDFYIVDVDIFNKIYDKERISLSRLEKLVADDSARKVSYCKLRDAVDGLVKSS